MGEKKSITNLFVSDRNVYSLADSDIEEIFALRKKDSEGSVMVELISYDNYNLKANVKLGKRIPEGWTFTYPTHLAEYEEVEYINLFEVDRA